jgi:hypothetical protein
MKTIKLLSVLLGINLCTFSMALARDHGGSGGHGADDNGAVAGQNPDDNGGGGAGHGSDDNGGSHSGGSDDSPGHHQGEANEIEGVEHFAGHIVLVPTDAAPQNAGGTAELEEENEHGYVFYKFDVKLLNLAPGTYSVSANLINSSNVVLGDVVVSSSRARGDLVLPAGVSVTDLTQVFVSDATGTVILAGDVNSPSSGTSTSFRSNVKLIPGPDAPNAKGKAQIKVSRKRGTLSERFNLSAAKLAPNTTYSILINGNEVRTVTTKKNGSLSIRNLDTELMDVTDVSLVNTSTQVEAAHAHF